MVIKYFVLLISISIVLFCHNGSYLLCASVRWCIPGEELGLHASFQLPHAVTIMFVFAVDINNSL